MSFRFEVPEHLGGERVDTVVAKMSEGWGAPMSRRAAKRVTERGGVTADGQTVRRASNILVSGQVVEVDWTPEPAPESVDIEPFVLLQDDAIIAINKPAGLPTHATHDPDRDHAAAAVERLLVRQGREPYVGIHHRLDIDTTGVLVFAVHRDANAGLASAFSERTARKSYLALVDGARETGSSWSVENHLGRDRHEKKRQTAVHSGGKFAATDFEVVDKQRDFALVRAVPSTGRMHQIRVHLAGCGCPILGDTLYGGRAALDGIELPRTMLHAWRLVISHPVSGLEVAITAPIPDDMRALALAVDLEIGAPER